MGPQGEQCSGGRQVPTSSAPLFSGWLPLLDLDPDIRSLMDTRRPWPPSIIRCVATRMIERKATGLDDDDTATLLFGLAGVSVASARLDESGNPILALVAACEAARCCP